MKKYILLLVLALTLTASAKNKDYHYKNYTVPSFIIAKAKADMDKDSLAREVWQSYLTAKRAGASQYAKVRFVSLAEKYAGFKLEKKGGEKK